MNRIPRLSALTALTVLALPAPAAVITSVGTTGVFDENVDATNALDIALPAGSLPTFKSSVLNAYNNNLGGVIDWETGVTATPSTGPSVTNTLTSITATYGVGASSSLTIDFDDSMDLYTNNINNQINALSQQGTFQNALVASFTDTRGLQYTMSFSGADVIELGTAFPSRSTYGSGVDFRATANFSGGGSSITNLTVGGTPGTGDTFLYFAAPSGESITSFTVAYVDDNGQNLANGQRRPVLDDVGFIVVPEPSTASAVGLGFLMLLARRRR